MLAKEAGRLRRPELADRLTRALDRGALLLVAPAGFGKTMALEEAAELRGGVVAWVHCSEADRDPGWLLGEVVDTLRTTVPGVADALGERLADGAGPVDVRTAVQALKVELQRLLVDPLVLVFDDAEHLADEADALQVVGELVGSQVSRLRVAISSRRALPLRAALPGGTDGVSELGAPDLALSADECGELLRATTGREPAQDEVETLWSATEGWPLGVALAAQSRRTAALDTSEALSQYLTEDLLGALDPEFRGAVIDSSVAPDLDPETLTALGLPRGFLDRVRSCGLPMSLLHGELERPAYHPLVRGLLRDLLERERPESRRRELHARVAGALEAAGRGPDAVEHWFSAAVPREAAGAVIRYGSALARSAPGTVEHWLERLPEEARAAPELQALEGRLASDAGRLEDALVPLRNAVEGFETRGDEEAAWLARLGLVDSLTRMEDFAAAIPLADGWESAAVPAAPMVAIVVAVSLAGADRYPEASDLSTRVAEHPFGLPLALFARATTGVDLLCGRLDDALQNLREAAAQLERDDPFRLLPLALAQQAIVRDERGEEGHALEAFARARRAADEAMLGGYFTDIGRRLAAGVHARAGRLVEAERELEALTGPGLGWYAGDVEITRATIAAGRGAHVDAVDWVGRAIAAGGLEPWRSRCRNTALLAPVLVRSGRPAWARELVDGAITARPPLASRARLLALRGWLRSLEGDEDAALDDLSLAWHEAIQSPAHLIRREAPRLEALLWTAAERGTFSPGELVAALEAATPGGEALLPFTRHPLAEMRRAALVAATASGHPQAADRLDALEQDPDAAVAAAARASRARLVKDPPPLVFRLLGGFRVRRGAFEMPDGAWERRIAQRLVRCLLVHRGAAVGEDALFEAFWPDKEPEQARRSLQVAVSSARTVLDYPGAPVSVLETVERTYRLRLSDRDVVDVDGYERAASAAGSATGPERLELLEAAAAQWGGEPLPEDRFEAWATIWRERLLDRHKWVLGELADARTERGDPAGAIEVARQAVELDRLDEGAQRRLMAAYARIGRRAQALRQYLACRRALVDELGVEPARETADLQRRILAGEVM